MRLCGVEIPPGSRRTLQLPLAPLYTHTEMAMPVHVVRGRREGPRLFLSAALHGDEINGTEIVRRVLRRKQLRQLRGTLVAVPVVNVYGFVTRSRYLPDRRDLNRSFPGSPKGSLAARLAHTFLEEIVSRCSHGIDLHTGAAHRTNLPHVRVTSDEDQALELARAFRAPLMLRAGLREGSLREAVRGMGIPVLVYEGGEALRLDEAAIQIGVRGVLAVLRFLGMLPRKTERSKGPHRLEPVLVEDSRWLRAPESGTWLPSRPVGAQVGEGDLLGILTDPLGEAAQEVRSPATGVILGQTQLPLVYEGEALVHLARFDASSPVTERLRRFEETLAAGEPFPVDSLAGGGRTDDPEPR